MAVDGAGGGFDVDGFGAVVVGLADVYAAFAGLFGGVGAELIAEYPSCFRAKVPTFDDLLVSAIEICLRKR